jgi:LysM repeat protein
MYAHNKPRFAPWRAPLVGASLVVAFGVGVPSTGSAQTLRGSMASVDRQNRVARDHDYTFLNDGERVRFFASQGWLVRVQPTRDFSLRGVSFPYARPEVELFVRRLGAQYRTACGEPLVVTSLTRPTSGQPSNASDKSVHPTGMAIDLRRPNGGGCRGWLERVLLDLERAGVIDATLERFPVHYHIAVFPRQYAAYVETRQSRQAPPVQLAVAIAQPSATVTDEERLEYLVRRGDSLWTIARTHGTTVEQLRTANQLASSRIYAGQVLDIPLG